jgi:hypothetical protein
VSTTTIEGFSLSHAAILDGTTGADLHDIYGVRNGSLSLSTSNYDNTGDDSVLSTWYWFDYGEVSIESGYVPFTTLAYLAGTSVTSSGASPNDYYAMPLWNTAYLNQSPRPMLLRVPSKDSAGAVRTLDIVLYKVQFEPFNFSGPQYKDGLLLSYSGRALRSSVDEIGNSLSEAAIGRILSRPSGTTGRFTV